MKVTITKYDLNISNESEHLEYLTLTKKIKSLGYKLFDTYNHDKSNKYYSDLPLEQTIETDTLFENQYNTVEGFRIFDWSETIYNNKNIKKGYYISKGVDKLKKAKANQLKCGFCGKRYDKSKTILIYCNACLDSEYLTEKELPLLRLQSLAGVKQGSGDVPKELTKAFNDNKQAYKDGQLGRMQKEAKELLEELAEKQKVQNYEAQVQYDLLMLGIPINNLIYYNHTSSWSYGWRDSVDLEEFNTFLKLVSDNDNKICKDLDGISLSNILHKANRGI